MSEASVERLGYSARVRLMEWDHGRRVVRLTVNGAAGATQIELHGDDARMLGAFLLSLGRETVLP